MSFYLFYFSMLQTDGLLMTQRFSLILILTSINGLSPHRLSKSTALCKRSSHAFPWRPSQTIPRPRVITVRCSLHTAVAFLLDNYHIFVCTEIAVIKTWLAFFSFKRFATVFSLSLSLCVFSLCFIFLF